MENSIIELSKYRLETAYSDLETARELYKLKQFRAAINRSYYAIFHSLRAVLALDNFDSSKHSGIIAYFNLYYVKEGYFEKGISKMISSAFNMREKADYEDFFIAYAEDAELQIEKADKIFSAIKVFLEDKWRK